jgi:uncharacterized protein (TIGR00730 family)
LSAHEAPDCARGGTQQKAGEMDDSKQSSAREQSVVKLNDEEGVKRILTQTVFGLWSLVNNLTRLEPSRREHYRITIFGSARPQPGHFVYEEVKRMSAAFAELGCDIVTGGGPGLMRAANEGAAQVQQEGRVQSVGIRVDLPFEQEVNPFVAQAFEHETFFTRLHHFVLVSDAYVVAPGGIGTVLEAMMIWQLLQVRHLHDRPLVFVGPMWRELVGWVERYMLRPDFELISKQDLSIPHCVDSAEEAIALIGESHASWRAKGEASR